MVRTEKLCVLYASKIHLSIILLEHILKNQEYEVITFLQNGLKKEINSITNLTDKYNTIKNTKIDNEINNNSEKLMFIIEGDDNYIKSSNRKIETMINENEKIKSVQIIVCSSYSNDRLIKEMSKRHYSLLQTKNQQILHEKY